MKRKYKILIISIIIVFLVLAINMFFIKGNTTEKVYTFSEIKKGDINVVVTCSGTLEATSTVDVGTQVSGKVAKLFVDFNSEVKKGQLLAVIDTVTLSAQIKDAIANLAKAKADHKQKSAIHERDKKLYEKNFISELDFIKSQADVEASSAALESAKTALERAKTNLDYAFIYAPISGKIINRSVEQGQTVAASLSAPILFTIAEDLSSMRIMASVDESDIGQIKEGQKVKFTVQAYTGKAFDGEVTQIRLKSTSSSNVINYTVVIKAPNSEKLLLPGMTATVDFYVDHRDNVLLVVNTALRFEPDAQMMEDIQKVMDSEMTKLSESKKGDFKDQTPPLPTAGNEKDKTSMNRVVYLDDIGKYRICPVITGLTDGKNTEIVLCGGLKEGTKIITGIQNKSAVSTKSTNVLNPSSQGMPPPPMM